MTLPQFARNFRTARRTLGWDIATLEKRTGVHRNQLQAYENGRRLPNLVNACKIARALGMALEQLCGDLET